MQVERSERSTSNLGTSHLYHHSTSHRQNMDSLNPHANIHNAAPVESASNSLSLILPPPRPKEFSRYTNSTGFTYIYAFSLHDAQNLIANRLSNHIPKSPIAVFMARTEDVADKPGTPWHLFYPALPVAAAKLLWTRNNCHPRPKLICRENFRAASGRMIQREYQWRDWQHNQEARCIVLDSPSTSSTTSVRYDDEPLWAYEDRTTLARLGAPNEEAGAPRVVRPVEGSLFLPYA